MHPTWKYHPEKGAKLINSKEELDALGSGWFNSPGDYGVETCPGLVPDPKIAANKVIFDRLMAAKKARDARRKAE